ncbi:integrator complex subunit 1 [Phlebotomus argentipes]|uniref:integrator complex subunit 1 n=1 Tax=Phlebotomus argentipes TaxID=94469 RepID=UPI00289344EA|nr:integrator complex subunit 1 [Phlebotomus argentipes]XP_059607686.1 integrator complex subunit 1 [Phlebotomus argentipes]
MERNKMLGSGRMSKGKCAMPPHSNELFALGKATPTASKPLERKRDLSGSSGSSAGPLTKKGRLSVGKPVEKPLGEMDLWEQSALECEPVELVASVFAAIDLQDSDTLIGLLCGSIKLMASTRHQPDNILLLSLLYLAKLRPNLFANEIVTSALVGVLKQQQLQQQQLQSQGPSFMERARTSSIVQVMVTNLLMRGYHDKAQWPDSFMHLFMEDAINERIWVDNDDCMCFVENICAQFGTKVPPKNILTSEITTLNVPGSSAVKETLNVDEESSESMQSNDMRSGLESMSDVVRKPRFTNIASTIEKLVVDTVKETLNRRQSPESSTKNFLRFLVSVCGIPEVRSQAISRLELWIHSGKLLKPAQELLAYICFNINGKITKDHEVLTNLVKIRLKTKQSINVYLLCIREMVKQQPDLLAILLKLVVQNELSNARNPNNMGMLASLFQEKPNATAKCLAEIYQEFLLQREDYFRTLRVFLRELVKILRYDVNLQVFTKSLLTFREDINYQLRHFEFKERVLQSIVDISCLCIFLSVSPQIREVVAALRIGKETQSNFNPILSGFYEHVAVIQLDTLIWIHEVVPVIFKPSSIEYTQILHKILFLDALEQYTKSDQWPPEPDRASLLRLVSEIPVREDALLRIIYIGVTKEIPFSVPDTMEIIEQIVKRAALFRFTDYATLSVNKLEIIDFLFSMAEYHHPDNITLPAGYEPPKLTISVLFWKAINILLLLSAHNPESIGAFCWEHYPLMRTLMEVCITNQFAELKKIEENAKIAVSEKSQILEFESHLAAATSKVIITEQNSLLLSQLMLIDPMGVSRKPPSVVLDQLKQLNVTYKLGHLLCRSRKPDFLLDIIQRHGTTQSMPWLADLVQNSEGEFSHLPVQCLCEFLLSNSQINLENLRDLELVSYLQNLLKVMSEDSPIPLEVLEYFLRRLASTSKQNREMSIRGLKLLLKIFDDDNATQFAPKDEFSDWLLNHLPQIPNFLHARQSIIVFLRAACQVENCPRLIMLYIQFIATHTLEDSLTEMIENIVDMSQLIVERSTVLCHITPQQGQERAQTLNCLFVMFSTYFKHLKEQKQTISWPEYQDVIMVRFYDGAELPIHLNILHALVILLTFSGAQPINMDEIIDYWFPVNNFIPTGWQIETMETVQILPDWLKLKMIRSSVDRLVDAALQNLTPDQVLLFLQSFGTPILSMSKLLALLDRIVIEKSDFVQSASLHRTYLAQLIEIQQSRGAKNGHIAAQALQLGAPTLKKLPPKSKIPMPDATTLGIDYRHTQFDLARIHKSGEIDDIVRQVIMNNGGLRKFRKLMQQLMSGDLADKVWFSVGKIAKNVQLEPQRCAHLCLIYRILLMNEGKSHKITQEVLRDSLNQVLMHHEPESKKKLKMEKKSDSALITFAQCQQDGNVIKSLIRKLREEKSRTGILVDMLVDLDSELISSHFDTQMELLFGTSEHKFRFYLLSLLSHQTNWRTLQDVLMKLLDAYTEANDAGAVLNFLSTIMNNPKLWQARDNKNHRDTVERIVEVDSKQIRVLVEYVIKEGDTKKLCSRVNLLLNCVRPDNIPHVIEYLLSEENESVVRRQFLQQLYLKVPFIKFLAGEEKRLQMIFNSNLQEFGECSADSITHCILTFISSLSGVKERQEVQENIELLVRKLAAAHPTIVLRQLPEIAGLLKGRAEMDSSVFRAENHMMVFNYFFGVLELMQPHIFAREHRVDLNTILTSYLHTLKQHHAHNKEVLSLIYRFTEFIEAYFNTSNGQAFQFIETHMRFFQELAQKNRSVPGLGQLLQNVSLQQHQTTKEGESVVASRSVDLVLNQPSFGISHHWTNIINQRSDDETVIPTLMEMSSLMMKSSTEMSEAYFEKLLTLLFSHLTPLRDTGYTLLIRYLRANPGHAKINTSATNAYFRCLTSDDLAVVSSALEVLSEMVTCLQESAKDILQCVFAIGVSSKFNTYAPLKRCVGVLKMQHAC